MKFIENWRREIWKRWSVRLQLIQTSITSMMVIDPGLLLGGWNMMPPAVQNLLPARFVQVLGIILVVLNFLTIFAVGVKQKTLESADAAKPE